MTLLKSLLLLSTLCFIALTRAQSTLPLCREECHKLRGKCNISLFELAQTPCFDDRTKEERTCSCGINNLQQLANLPAGTTIRDCVISSLLFNTDGSRVIVNAKLENVHATGYLTVGFLEQKGDIESSTFCKFQCTGTNRFQNCVLSGSVTRSHMEVLSALDEATISISGRQFKENTVNFIRSDKDIQVGCADGFDDNTINNFAQRKLGKVTTVLGTRITRNRFNTMIVGPVQSFATVEGNTAGVATAEGPCNVINVRSPIFVEDFLALPDGDRECTELFRKI